MWSLSVFDVVTDTFKVLAVDKCIQLWMIKGSELKF